MTVDGKSVMGIAPFRSDTLTISPDPHLSWVMPLDWSLEDAATVPFSYSLVFTGFEWFSETYNLLSVTLGLIFLEKTLGQTK